MTRPGPPLRAVSVDGRTLERIPIRIAVLMPEHTMGVRELYECVIPAPADPHGTVRRLKAATGYDIAIRDVNDVKPAWCVASTLSPERRRLLERSFDDNQLGQRDEQTPLGIWREISA